MESNGKPDINLSEGSALRLSASAQQQHQNLDADRVPKLLPSRVVPRIMKRVRSERGVSPMQRGFACGHILGELICTNRVILFDDAGDMKNGSDANLGTGSHHNAIFASTITSPSVDGYRLKILN